MTIAGLAPRKARKLQTDAPADQAAVQGRRLRRGLWAALAVVLLLSAYPLAGYYGVPAILRHEANGWARDTLKKPIRLGDIRFDPLRFTLDVHNLAIPDAPQPMLAADNIHVGFSVWSLLRGPYTFTEVRLQRPRVRAEIRPDGSLNLADLLPKTKTPTKPGRAVRISAFSVQHGELAFTDQSLPERPQTIFLPVAFTLKDFQTDRAAGGTFTLSASSQLGETFAWSGALSAAPIHSSGRIKVGALRAQTIEAFLGPSAPADFQSGLVDLTTDYDARYSGSTLSLDLSHADLGVTGLKAVGGLLPAGGAVSVDRVQARLDRLRATMGARQAIGVQADLSSATASGLALAAPGQPLRIATVSLTGARFDSAARRVQADALTADRADLRVRRTADGRLSLASLLAPLRPPASASAPVAQPAPWSLHLGRAALNRARLDFEDQAVTPAVHALVTPIDLTLTGVDSDLAKPVAVRLSARMEAARVEVSGSAIPASGAGELKVDLSSLPLATILSYSPKLRGLDLTSGEVSASGALRFKGADAGALRFDGQASIDKVSARQPSTDGLLFSWDALRLHGLRYASGQATVEEGVLTTPVARVVLLADGTLNLATVAGPPAPANAPSATPVVLAQTAAAPATPAALPLTLKRLTLSGGTLELADFSIDPNFQARVEALQGSMTNLTNAPGAIVGVDLAGRMIDPFSPVSIKGSLDPLDFTRRTDLRLDFRNIDLALFNPYSGRYAGYAVAKGKLTTELSYKIDQRKLVAGHHVVINQLQWGQATDSKAKAPFPVRLATALLKDKDGVINLDVPVTGSLDDPKFRVWPIIWQIVGNVLEKAAVAPFRLIGSLFAGADKAQYIDFEPGSAALPPETAQSLGALTKALAQKKELNLDIPAGPGLDADAAALTEQRIDAAVAAQKKGSPAAMATLSPDEQVRRTRALYQAQFRKPPVFPPPAARPTAEAKPSAAQRQSQQLAWMREQLRPAFAPSKAELAQLGAARARAVRDALLSGAAVDPTRVFMTPQDAASLADGHARLELAIH
jgi:uncharacterized protein involved in outer membrane biogenesis